MSHPSVPTTTASARSDIRAGTYAATAHRFRGTMMREGPVLLHRSVTGLPDVRKVAARSAMASTVAFVLPETIEGMTDASAMRRFSMPCTRRSGATTACVSVPMRQVPTKWW
jgi:hypothetical protein